MVGRGRRDVGGEEPGRDLTFPEWSKSGLQPGDRLKVKIVEIKNFRSVFLHPDDPSCQYLGIYSGL